MEPSSPEAGASLHADCDSCFGLCCVVPAFTVSSDFAITKKAGHACPNLAEDFGCGIHPRLREEGFAGCTVYDCFGAGQKVSQVTFGGKDWRRAPVVARAMFEVFPVVRALHELLWYLTEALTLLPTGSLHAELRLALERTQGLTSLDPDALSALDVGAHRAAVNVLLQRTSEQVRADVRRERRDLRGADLIGAKLGGADLRGASLRGAHLVGADLCGADLGMADLIGADLRGADLRGANLTGSIFLIQSQLDSAKGDARTSLPAALRHPMHW
ncbi:MAG: pentapeptide repeat-containing protein [Dermatophilaceae bacterium]